MFINPRVAIEKGWITGKIDEKNIQPNAIDFTLDKLFTIEDRMTFVVSEVAKQMRGGTEVRAVEMEIFSEHERTLDSIKYVTKPELRGIYWCLEGKTSYDGMSEYYVNLPEGVAAYMIVRSTFNRNGIFITSGLYDSGFKGNIGFAIHNNSGSAYIAPGTRIGQIIFVESNSAGMYAGQYNTSQGQHWAEKK